MTMLRLSQASQRSMKQMMLCRRYMQRNQQATQLLLPQNHSTSASTSPNPIDDSTNGITAAVGYHHRWFHSSTRQEKELPAMSSFRDKGDSLDEDTNNDTNLLNSTDMEFFDDIYGNDFESDEELAAAKAKALAEEEEERDAARRQVIRDEIDLRKGRLWEDPWEITDDDWASGKSFDDLPDWNDTLCSRVSLERVKVHADGIPTLDTLAKMNLPTSYPSHPARGDPQPYLKHRKRTIKDNIYKAVVEAGKPRVEKILSMEDWNAKQDAIDVLFEEIHDLVKIKDGQKNNSDISGEGDDNEYLGIVLASQPNFPKLVELALEEYLRNVVKNEKNQNVSEENDEDDSNNAYEPIFMDLLKGGKTKVDDENHVPEILNPIKPHPKDGPGRMLEEWELSANQNTKRIMCRKCISDIAEVVQSNDSGNNRVFVHGSKGAGKSAALAAIVASARISGHIVLYLPDGKRLSRNGFYVEPSAARGANGEVMFDLPILTNEVCGELLTSHEKDFDGMIVPDDVVKKYLSSDQIIKLEKKVQINDGGYNLIELLKVGSENTSIGGGCFGAVINSIMNQNEKTFTVVMDEFNCYFEQGYYFHQEYKNASKSIPANRMTLFQPLMDVIGVEQQDDGSFSAKDPLSIKNGSIVVGVSDSHAVAVKTNKALEVAIQSVGCKLVNVPQYSPVEVEHVLANFEIIGLGKLRFDRGATVMNRQEVAYLRMISGGIGQRLLDACIMP